MGARGSQNFLASVGSITDLVDPSQSPQKTCSIDRQVDHGSIPKLLHMLCAYFPVVRSPFDLCFTEILPFFV
jgi:hypothetical protein